MINSLATGNNYPVREGLNTQRSETLMLSYPQTAGNREGDGREWSMLLSTRRGQGKHRIDAGEADLRVEESHPEFLKFLEVVGLSSMSFL